MLNCSQPRGRGIVACEGARGKLNGVAQLVVPPEPEPDWAPFAGRNLVTTQRPRRFLSAEVTPTYHLPKRREAGSLWYDSSTNHSGGEARAPRRHPPRAQPWRMTRAVCSALAASFLGLSSRHAFRRGRGGDPVQFSHGDRSQFTGARLRHHTSTAISTVASFPTTETIRTSTTRPATRARTRVGSGVSPPQPSPWEGEGGVGVGADG